MSFRIFVLVIFMFHGLHDHAPLQDHQQEMEEPVLILDGGLPRYSSSKVLPVVDATEMAVDEEEEEEDETTAESSTSLHNKSPLSWQDWTMSSMKTSEAQQVTVTLTHFGLRTVDFPHFFKISFLDTE